MTDKFRHFELDLLGLSETHIPGVENMKLGNIAFIYSSRKDGMHRQGEGLMTNKEAAKFCLFWKDINKRMLVAHFMTKKCRVSVMVVKLQNRLMEIVVTWMNDTSGYRSQDRTPGKNIVEIFLLGDLNSQVNRNRDRS